MMFSKYDRMEWLLPKFIGLRGIPSPSKSKCYLFDGWLIN